MKIPLIHSWRQRQQAFTLTETMITASLAVVLLGGLLTGHLAGIRMFQYTRTKLGGNDDARSAVSHMIEEIRSAKKIRIGNGDVGSFTECAINTVQQGNAVQIYATTSTNNFIRYFRGTDDCLRRTTNGANSAVVMANWITNKVVFSSEDFAGNVLTNNENNRVIGLTMQFYQIQYPIVKIGSNQLYDFYQVRTKITRRMLE
jgi:type II secretory pathway pseudopilin PulG